MLSQFFHDWKPFKIDALGLVTLLGAEEMNLALRALIWSDLKECLHLTAAYAVANNDIMTPKSGFTLYNISDVMKGAGIAAWFYR